MNSYAYTSLFLIFLATTIYNMEMPKKIRTAVAIAAQYEITKAASRGDLAAVTLLLASGVDPDARNGQPVKDEYGLNPHAGNTPLMNACLAGNLTIVQALLAAGANPNLYNTRGLTALLLCNKHAHVMVELLNAGADPNIPNQTNGFTALMYSIMCRDLERTKLLLSKGANPDLVNIQKWSAYEYAQQTGIQFQVALLIALLKAEIPLTQPDDLIPVDRIAITNTIK